MYNGRIPMFMKLYIVLVIVILSIFNLISCKQDLVLSKEKKEILLDVPLICQMCELNNGCEITSVTMLLNYKGIEIDKMVLAQEMKRDDTELVRDENGNILIWGNPKNGFVGNVESDNPPGYIVDPEALIPLINKYYTKNAKDLTGKNIEEIEASLNAENPVVVWVTGGFKKPSEFIRWKDRDGNEVRGTFESHTVILTGYDAENFYYNDPLTEEKNAIIDKENFTDIWSDMGSKAITVN